MSTGEEVPPALAGEEERVRRTYIGERYDGKGRLLHHWRAENGSVYIHDHRQTKFPAGLAPGAVYEFVKTGGRIYVSGEKGPRYVGRHPDAEDIARWTAAQAADRALRRQARQAKNDLGPDRLAELLQPLMTEYRRRNPDGRTALIATVIRYMTTGRA